MSFFVDIKRYFLSLFLNFKIFFSKKKKKMGNCSSNTRKVQSSQEQSEGDDEERISFNSVPKYLAFTTFFNTQSDPRVCDWIFKKEIGRTAMSKVYIVENSNTGEIAAAKIYDILKFQKTNLGKSESPTDAINTEMEIMMQIAHRYVLTLIEAIEDDNTQSFIFFMPYAQYGDVQTLLNKGEMTNEMISICFHQIAIALEELHAHNIVHRDVKSENFLSFDRDYYVLSDFSVSKRLESDDQKLEDTKGSPAFLSPEECSGEAFLPKPTDVWAYGVSLYYALFRKLPFHLSEIEDCGFGNMILLMTEKIQACELDFPDNADIDPLAKDLISKILVKDPLKRPKFSEIHRHEYFKDCWPIDEKNIEEAAGTEEEEFNEEQIEKEQQQS